MKHPKGYDTTPEISRRMSHVRLKRGKAETALAKALWKKGYRYRLNWKALPGSPDIALTKYRLAVFVDGEFWHGCGWQSKRDRLKANRAYWVEKIEENIARDRRDDQRLAAMGWTSLRFWEKDVERDLGSCVQTIEGAVLEALVEERGAVPEDLPLSEEL